MYGELFSGIGIDPAEAIDTVFEEDTSDPVLLRDVVMTVRC